MIKIWTEEDERGEGSSSRRRKSRPSKFAILILISKSFLIFISVHFEFSLICINLLPLCYSNFVILLIYNFEWFSFLHR